MFTRSIAPALSRAFLSTFFVFAILSPTAAQLPEPARDTLVVGIQDESGPYELVVANNFVGFNVDILREVGERVGVAFSFVRDDYDKLKRYLADGDIDLILMDYGPEPGSRDTVSRTLAYNSMELAIFASVYQLFNPDDFGQYELVTDREAFVRAFAQMPRGGKCVNIEGRRRRDMLRGHVSQQRKYLLLPSNIGAFLVDNYQIEDVWSIPFKGPAVSYSMAFRMADSSLAAAFDIALRQSIVGTGYSKAKNKWFGMLPAVASKPYKAQASGTPVGLFVALGVWIAIAVALASLWWRTRARLVDERRRRDDAEGKYAESRRRLRFLIESIPHPVAVRDLAGRVLAANAELYKLLGVPADSPDAARQAITADERFARLLDGESTPQQETQRIIDGNGQLRSFLVSRSLYEPERGDPAVVTFAFDISVRHMFEKRLERESALLTSIINSIPDIIFYKDVHFRYLGGNRAFREYYGFSDADFVGKTDFEIYDVKQAIEYNNLDRQVVEKNEPRRVECWGTPPGGESALMDTIKTPFRNSDGDILGLVGICRDITDIHLTQQKLREAKERAEESDQMKSSFMSIVSHEIRTPLNSIIGFTDLLLDKELTTDQREDFIEMIRSSSSSLRQLVEDIIDLSKIQDGSVVLNLQQRPPSAIVREVYSLYDEQLVGAADHKAVLRVERSGGEGSEPLAYLDAMRVRQVMGYLIDAAVSYSRKAHITIGAESDEGYVEFYVANTDPSIAPQAASHAFDALRTPGEIKSDAGPGLSLILAKGLVGLMRGQIVARRPDDGAGIEFRFFIPAKPVEDSLEAEQRWQASPHGDSRRALLVADDDDKNVAFLNEALKNCGYRLLWASNGREALDIFEANPDVALVLTDIRMPIMDGRELARRVKATRPSVPVVALTAYADDDEKSRSLEAGCDAYLTKPIRVKSLLNAIHRFLQ